MAPTPEQTEALRALCPNIYYPGTPTFDEKAAPWSVWADRHPQLVVEPTDLETISKVVKFLYDSDLDFCVRNTGTGGSSAKDICLNMHGFKSLHFDAETETVVAGAGLAWGEVDLLMQNATKGEFGCVGARCTWVGIAGSSLVGGLSWLSHEYGMMSDPQNLLDAQVVLADGRVVWAAQEEPDLMWALRGGGGNFGIITTLKFRARPTPQKIFAAIVLLPYTSLTAVSHAIAALHRRPSDPKVAMHIMNQGPGMGQSDQGSRPGIGLLPVDFHGEAHARSKDASGLGWMWDLPGAQELVSGEFTYQQVNALADSFKDYQGKNLFWLSANLIDDIDEEMLVRAWKWYEDCIDLHPGFGVGSTVLLEFMQEPAFNSSGSRTATAWPHSGRKHVMQLVLGCELDSLSSDQTHSTSRSFIRDLVMQQFAKAGPQIGREASTGEFHAGFLHEWNDLSQVYGGNYPRLKELKKRYDPRNRFNKGVDLAEGKVTSGMTV